MQAFCLGWWPFFLFLCASLNSKIEEIFKFLQVRLGAQPTQISSLLLLQITFVTDLADGSFTCIDFHQKYSL